MSRFAQKVKEKKKNFALHNAFENEAGAIDLASIMVGIIVIGLVGGVIAATVFAVIPWAQDNAAKQQLDSVVSAQQAYFGLSADPSRESEKRNSYGNGHDLEKAGLITRERSYCTTGAGDKFSAFALSSSGKMFSVTDSKTKPETFTDSLPSYCGYLVGQGAYDPTSKTTTLTYRCDTATTGVIPMNKNLTGTETWSDGVEKTYSDAAFAQTRTFEANKDYTVIFEGTYRNMRATTSDESKALNSCLRSVGHWGKDVGLTDGTSAFYLATNLTDVPDSIPSTVQNFYHMFGATSINDPDISKWNMSSATSTRGMFVGNWKFNQPLNSWNMSSVTLANNMFEGAKAFNQPLNNWNMSKIDTMDSMFLGADAFNQDLSSWNTSAAKSATAFANPTFPNNFLPPKATK